MMNASVLNGAEYEGIVKGRITDRNTSEPLAGVYVLYGKQSGTSSDKDGYYLIKTNSDRFLLLFNPLAMCPLPEIFQLAQTIRSSLI